MKRRLAAILAADVVGYSGLTAADEEGTHARLKALRKDFIEPTIAKHDGRIVKLTGDGALVDFPSVVDAVKCAAAIQAGVAERQADQPDERRIVFRIGINSGDVIIEDDDIYGDGVNVAARLEGLAEPGGVCISGKVHEEVKNKVAFGFEPMGEHQVKNIPEPVVAYRVVTDPGFVAKTLGLKRVGTSPWRWAALAAVTGAIAAGGWAAVQFQPWTWLDPEWRDARDLSAEPSVAVLPFASLSSDPEQAHFGRSMSEDIITELARYQDLHVVALHSTQTVSKLDVNVREIGQRLHARYIVEGSVRRGTDRIRVTAQLIDAETGRHLWAEKFDRPLEDVFSIQDELTTQIVASTVPHLRRAETRDAFQKPTSSLTAYELVRKGKELKHTFTPAANRQAQEVLRRAIELDRSYAAAYAWLGFTRFVEAVDYLPLGARETALAEAEELARKAIDLDPELIVGYQALSQILSQLPGQLGEALDASGKAVELAPSDAESWAFHSVVLYFRAEADEAVSAIERAYQLNPIPPAYYDMFAGRAYLLAERHDDALKRSRDCARKAPGWWLCYLYQALAADALGEEAVVKSAVARVKDLFPGMMGQIAKTLPAGDVGLRAHIQQVFAELAQPRS
jgi:adenylate cyclase